MTMITNLRKSPRRWGFGLLLALVGLWSLVLPGCTTLDVSATTLKPDVLASARTFGAGDAEPVSLGENADPQAADWIVEAVVSELEARGLEASDDPDIIGAATGMVESRTVRFAGFGRRTSAAGGGASTMDYLKGTLVIEFYDAGTKELLWRGVAEDVLGADSSQAQIEQVVARMFAASWPDGGA
jgi:hypothetical protein